ncbi:MAG: carboxypeptidase-like regulatory domain-containing protein [Saprospiraceae bacterium]
MVNGELFELDVQLVPLTQYQKQGFVFETASATGVPAAQILMDNGETQFTFVADEQGNFLMTGVYESVYDIYVGAWGYHTLLLEDVVIDNNEDFIVELDKGYEDGFALDLGWITTADANVRAGFWERGEPIGTYSGANIGNPEFDMEGDLGDQCFVTGNAGGSISGDDLDGGEVVLISPAMQLASTYVSPVLEYNAWLFWVAETACPMILCL